MEKLKNRKVLITGHTGFKGSWLTYTLINLGAKVYGVSLKPDKKINKNFFLFELNKKCKNFYFDINNILKINNLINTVKPEIIYHFAAQPLVSESYKDPIKTFKTNIIGTQNVLESCRGKKFIKNILISTTDKVYENTKVKRFKENDKLSGDDPYSASKAATEILINAYSKCFLKNINIATVRAGNVIGFGDYSKNRIIPDIINSIYSNKILKIRQIESYRPWYNILDVICAYLKLLLYIEKKNMSFSNWNFSPKGYSKYTVKNIIYKLSQISKKNIQYKLLKGKLKFNEKKYLSLNSNKALKKLKINNQHIDQTLKQIYKLNELYYSNQNVMAEIDRYIQRYIINEI